MISPPPGPLSAEMVVRNINSLPQPSGIISDLLRCIDDENASAAELAEVIARDQALVARLLRIANSPFYGLRGQVESIPNAISILGLRAVHGLATASAFCGTFAAISSSEFSIATYSRHSLAGALCSRALARRMRIGEGGAFVAGLLHDIGRLMFACAFPAHLAAASGYRQEHGGAMHEAELAVAGMDHGQIGGILGERWHFPPAICNAIANHHRPDDCGSGVLAGVVHLGDALAHAMDLAEDSLDAVPSISEAAWRKADLAWRDSQEIFAEVEHEFAALSKVLLN
jgi:HD-like signal output (HDOD) protein